MVALLIRAGSYYDQELVTLQKIKERRLRILHERGYLKTVFLRADRRVAYGVVVTAMDLMKKIGIENLGIVTDPYEAVLLIIGHEMKGDDPRRAQICFEKDDSYNAWKVAQLPHPFTIRFLIYRTHF